MSNSADSRIEALEIKVAYQDEAIEQLNGIVTAQWKQIEALTKEIKRLTDRIEAAELQLPATPGTEPPPPHY